MTITLPKSSQPIKKSSYHHGDLRVSIIDAVAHLIGKGNSLNFHLKEVADLVGTSQPAIYRHFDGKKSLLVETAVKGYQLQKMFRDNAIDQAQGSALSKVLAVCYAYVNFSKEYPGYFLLMKTLETEEMLSSKRYLAEQSHVRGLVTELISQCLDEGVFEPVDIQLALTVMQSSAYGLAHLYLTKQIERIAPQNYDEQHFAEQVIERSIRSLLSSRGEKQLENLLKQSRR
jgi:AcrR family transcriptional regulator